MAGVSWSTVSNVINNHPSVRPETRAKVEEAIEILGYRPNAAARSLRRSESETVLVMAGSLSHPLASDLLQAVVGEIHSRGLSTLLEPAAVPHRSVARTLEHARAHDHTGAVLITYPDPAFPHGAASAHPLLVASRLGDDDAACAVTCDLRREVADLVTSVLARGARRPTLVTSPSLQSPLLDLFVTELAAHGAPAGTSAVVVAHDDSVQAGAAAASHLGATGADAVVCASEELARGVLARRSDRLPPAMIGCLRASTLLTSEHPDLAATVPDCQALASRTLDVILAAESPVTLQLAAYRCHG